MAHHAVARYDESDSMFLPPLRTIGFNPQLVMNDSLLAQSYLEAYDISYPEALARIDDDVNELRQHIENDGEYEMVDIGTIRMNEYGCYEFEPCQAGLLTPTLYGFGAFEMEPLANQSQTTPPANTATDDLPVALVAESQPSASHPEDAEEQLTPRSAAMWRYVAAACIAVVAFLLMPSPLDNTNGESRMDTHIDTRLLYRLMPKNITIGTPKLVPMQNPRKEQVVNNTESSTKSTQASATQAVQAAATPHQSTWCIVLASKVSRAGAEAFLEKLRAEGYKTVEVLQQEGGCKVVYGSFTSEAEARNRLNSLKGQPDAWVMKRPNT